MSFLDNYEPVEERIRKFWAKHPEGRIHTEIVLINEQEIVIKASIFRDKEDPRPASIDFAQETRGSSNINRQSFVENCATSAIGRGLASLGFAPKGARPSKEEMRKSVKLSDTVARNWDVEAKALHSSGDFVGLQKVYKEAVTGKASKETLDLITRLGKELAEKSKADSPQK